MVKKNIFRLILATICSLVVAGATVASAYLVKPAIDDIFFKRDVRMLIVIPLAVIVVYFFRGLGMFGQEYWMTYVGKNIIRELRDNLYDHIHNLSLAFFRKEKTGVLMSRITHDVNVIERLVSSSIAGSVRDFFSIIGLTGVLFYQNWKMALIAFAVLPLAFYPVVALGKRVRRVSRRYQEAMGNLSAFLHETFAGNVIVKAFGMESYEKKRFFDKTRHLFELEMKQIVTKSLSSPIMEFIGGLGVAFVIWYGGYQVIQGTSTAGTFFSFMAAVIMLYDPVKKLSKLNSEVQRGLAASDRIFEILETKSDIVEKPYPIQLRHGPYTVTFKKVHFKYEQVMILKNINLEVKTGEIVALVGMSGGGKTTLVHLIPRFYDVTSGSIQIDETDIREFSLSSLRSRIAIVTQDPILFNDTIRNNIAYGKPDASDEEIEKVAKAAYAYDFIHGFPDKFDTFIGELGGRLSGGEKQRICIARALLKDAPVLILDEATSSLDTESEMIVQMALENLMQGRTTFIIAHRLSTIAYADRIIVIVNGEIVEEGTHAELMAACGEYYKLYQMQFKNNCETS